MKISVTDLGTYERCRRQWDLSSNIRRNLTGVGAGPAALELGSLIHRAQGGWLLEPTRKLVEIFNEQAADRVAEIEIKYQEVVGATISDEELAPVLDNIELGRAMCVNYEIQYKTPVPRFMKFAAAEQEIVVDIPGTEHPCEDCNGNGGKKLYAKICESCNNTGVLYHQLTMTLDGLLQDDKDRLYVLERKTISPRFVPTYETLSMNAQFGRYAWGVRQVAQHFNAGGQVAGIVYDGMIKRATPARGKTLDDLFIRKMIPKMPEELDEIGRRLAEEVNEIAAGPPLYPTVPWQGCFDCSFTDVCLIMMQGNDPEFLIKSKYTQRETVRISGIRDDTN